jgi:hypothetical protein
MQYFRRWIPVVATLVLTVVLAIPAAANATTIDFNSGVPSGLATDLSFTYWGGGHLYVPDVYWDRHIAFDSPTSVSSLEMNPFPFPDQYVYGQSVDGLYLPVHLAAFSAASDLLWSATVDLGRNPAYDWDQWQTVTVGVANVSTLVVYNSKTYFGVGFYPAIDNLVVNEQVPDAGSSLFLLGMGLAGLKAWRRRIG